MSVGLPTRLDLHRRAHLVAVGRFRMICNWPAQVRWARRRRGEWTTVNRQRGGYRRSPVAIGADAKLHCRCRSRSDCRMIGTLNRQNVRIVHLCRLQRRVPTAVLRDFGDYWRDCPASAFAVVGRPLCDQAGIPIAGEPSVLSEVSRIPHVQCAIRLFQNPALAGVTPNRVARDAGLWLPSRCGHGEALWV